MRIVWYTIRNFGDMCATTPVEIAKQLVKRGHELTIVNPDLTENHTSHGWSHASVWEKKFNPGFRARKIALNMRKRIVGDVDAADICLVDWAILPYLVKSLETTGCPIIMMDRSPPAYSNVLGKIQWLTWKKAWRFVLKRTIVSGCVVSTAHKNFVERKIGVASDNIFVLNAGVDSDVFFPVEQHIHGPLKFVYHGQLDKNRGVLALPLFVQNLISNGVNAELTLIGSGNTAHRLKEMGEAYHWLNVYDSVPHSHIPAILRKHDIGLLPMPNHGIWPLASPLKRGEYLASGLLVFGIDHSGHALEFTEADYYKLVHQEDFHTQGLRWVQGLTYTTIAEGKKEAREVAKKHLEWDATVDVLEDAMRLALQNQKLISSQRDE